MKTDETIYIFIGSQNGNIPYDYLISKYCKHNISVSNSEFERTLVSEFSKKIIGNRVFTIAAPSVGKWPKSCKKIRFCESFISSQITFCSYLTVYGISNFSKGRSILRALKNKLKSLNCSNVVVIGCEAHKPYLKALRYAKKKGCVTSLIVPDLPEDMKSSNSFIYKIFKRKDVKDIVYLANNYVDCFYFFTEKIAQHFDVGNKPYLIREGIIEHINFENNNNNQPICSYIGKTDKRNGLEAIINVAKLMPNVQFNIYGSGDMDKDLESILIPNLSFKGFADPTMIENIMENSNVLISLRYPGESYTSASFPSKILKYVSSGKPIVTYKLPCYSSKFDNLLFYPKEISESGIVQALIEALKEENKDMSSKYKDILTELFVENVVNDYIKMINKCIKV